jgi:hypothetical protein
LGEASEDIQGKLTAQNALIKGEDNTSRSCIISKVLVVMLRGAVEGFIEGGRLFKWYVNKMNWGKGAEGRKGYRAHSPFSLAHSQEFEV